MKVHSLYNKDKVFLGAFPSREDAVKYGQVFKSADENGWDYDIIEEYLSKSPLVYTFPTTPGPTIPYTHPPVISKPPARYDDGSLYDDGVKVTYFAGPQGNDGITDYGLNGVQQ
jgi:hypothetical protein